MSTLMIFFVKIRGVPADLPLHYLPDGPIAHGRWRSSCSRAAPRNCFVQNLREVIVRLLSMLEDDRKY
jgi:hypothetical protein